MGICLFSITNTGSNVKSFWCMKERERERISSLDQEIGKTTLIGNLT